MTKWKDRPTPIQKNLLKAIEEGGKVEVKQGKDKRFKTTRIVMPDGESMAARLSQIKKLKDLGLI